MSVRIHEPIAVAVIFSNGSIKPRYFLWHEKKIVIESVSFMWKTMVGAANLLHFTVTSERTLYELVFDTKALTWKLEQVEAQGR
jgi:hypothetical protein